MGILNTSAALCWLILVAMLHDRYGQLWCKRRDMEYWRNLDLDTKKTAPPTN
jgi:hypothetical protein